MRSGRIVNLRLSDEGGSLDDWEMRSGRNGDDINKLIERSLDDWEMRSGRNALGRRQEPSSQSARGKRAGRPSVKTKSPTHL